MFYPEMAAHGLSGATLTGLLLCVGGTLCFCTGNLLSAANQRRGLPIVSVNAWGMLYGTLWSGFLALLLGKPFIVEPTLSYFGSLVFLAVVSTVIAFARLSDAARPDRRGARRLFDRDVSGVCAADFDGARRLCLDALRDRRPGAGRRRQRAGHCNRDESGLIVCVSTPGSARLIGLAGLTGLVWPVLTWLFGLAVLAWRS